MLPLIAEYCRQLLDWFQKGKRWEVESRNIKFREESRFCLRMHDGRKKVRHNHEERRDIGFSMEWHVTRLLQ